MVGKIPNAINIRRVGKSETAFRTISEVASDLSVPQHVLRFWESKFNQLKPLKRGGGRRYYRPEDITQLRRIKSLLYNDGYTIKGVQKLLKEKSDKHVLVSGKVVSAGNAPDENGPNQQTELSGNVRDEIEAAIMELQTIRSLLKIRR